MALLFYAVPLPHTVVRRQGGGRGRSGGGQQGTAPVLLPAHDVLNCSWDAIELLPINTKILNKLVLVSFQVWHAKAQLLVFYDTC